MNFWLLIKSNILLLLSTEYIIQIIGANYVKPNVLLSRNGLKFPSVIVKWQKRGYRRRHLISTCCGNAKPFSAFCKPSNRSTSNVDSDVTTLQTDDVTQDVTDINGNPITNIDSVTDIKMVTDANGKIVSISSGSVTSKAGTNVVGSPGRTGTNVGSAGGTGTNVGSAGGTGSNVGSAGGTGTNVGSAGGTGVAGNGGSGITTAKSNVPANQGAIGTGVTNVPFVVYTVTYTAPGDFAPTQATITTTLPPSNATQSADTTLPANTTVHTAVVTVLPSAVTTTLPSSTTTVTRAVTTSVTTLMTTTTTAGQTTTKTTVGQTTLTTITAGQTTTTITTAGQTTTTITTAGQNTPTTTAAGQTTTTITTAGQTTTTTIITTTTVITTTTKAGSTTCTPSCPSFACTKDPTKFDAAGNLLNPTQYGTWKVITYGNGISKNYMFGTVILTRDDCWKFCCSIGMDLVSLNSGAELTAVSDNGPASGRFWTTGSSILCVRNAAWCPKLFNENSSMLAAQSIPWIPNIAPNDDGTQQCISIYYGTRSGINDWKCNDTTDLSARSAALCEGLTTLSPSAG